MKHFIIGTILLFAGAGLFTGCNETRTIYDGQAYVMFSDTLSICPVTEDQREFAIHIASLSACDYDRTYAVETMGNASNAVEGFHYSLESHTLTIPAGKTSARINVHAEYDRFEDTDSLGFQLRLLSTHGDAWSDAGSTTKVRFQKICPFEPHALVGSCRIYSLFLLNFTGNLNRTCTCRMDDTDPNVLVFEDFFDDDYDLRIRVDNVSDPLLPQLLLPEDQCVGDTRRLLGAPYGNNQLMVTEVPGTVSTIDFCKRKARLYLYLYVKDVGYVGAFENLLVWTDDYEAK